MAGIRPITESLIPLASTCEPRFAGAFFLQYHRFASTETFLAFQLMEAYLMITQINDFLFCPRSMYFSGIYRNTTTKEVYHQTPQTIGQANHKSIDEKTYSSHKDIITSMMVYSSKYNLLGCIDILDTQTGLLTERKYSVTAVYEGLRFQLFGQYFALTEMGYRVNAMRIHSSKDNKNYEIALPDAASTAKFEQTLYDINHFSLNTPFTPNPRKCEKCIYSPLCDYGCLLAEEATQ